MTDVWAFWPSALVIILQVFFLPTNGNKQCSSARNMSAGASASPEPNRFCQDKNVQLLGNSNSAPMVDHSSQMLPGNELLIKAEWY